MPTTTASDRNCVARFVTCARRFDRDSPRCQRLRHIHQTDPLPRGSDSPRQVQRGPHSRAALFREFAIVGRLILLAKTLDRDRPGSWNATRSGRAGRLSSDSMSLLGSIRTRGTIRPVSKGLSLVGLRRLRVFLHLRFLLSPDPRPVPSPTRRTAMKENSRTLSSLDNDERRCSFPFLDFTLFLSSLSNLELM